MGIRKKIGELEALQTADDNSDDTLKDKSFIRTLRARLQLMSTELEGKINRNELEAKADITEMNRLASIITAMRRTTSTEAIDQTNVSVSYCQRQHIDAYSDNAMSRSGGGLHRRNNCT
uniref:Uncharacterized protein n=1 Tax=Spongospora subterranea TaxID=70186 RepID=A0A0H5QN53_9EUKA|eukprot:CRZ02977.1 hypothetical protein [Spongospora subterranea]